MTALLDQSLVETARLLRRWSRQQEVLTTTLVLPILLLLLFQLVLNKSLTTPDGIEPIYGFVPMIAVPLRSAANSVSLLTRANSSVLNTSFTESSVAPSENPP